MEQSVQKNTSNGQQVPADDDLNIIAPNDDDEAGHSASAPSAPEAASIAEDSALTASALEAAPIAEDSALTASAPEAAPSADSLAASERKETQSKTESWAVLDNLLPGYHELVPIGHGAQATVFKALDDNGNIVAIKTFNQQTFADWKDEELLRREVETLRTLSCFGVPEFIDFIEKPPYYFLIESYIDAPSMSALIDSGYRPTWEDVIAILTSAAHVFRILEDRPIPIIHRDVKPANILVGRDRRVSIVDFGVVAAIRQHTVGMTFAGTAGYVAPEQLYGKVTPAADMFGLGMSMLHLITHVAPCDMEMKGLKPSIEKYLPSNTPDELAILLHDMIEPDPEHRIQSAMQLIQRLDALDLSAVLSSVNKKKEKIRRKTEKERVALRRKAREKQEREAEKLSRVIAGPRVKKNKEDPFRKIRKIAHSRVMNRISFVRMAFFQSLTRFVICGGIVLIAFAACVILAILDVFSAETLDMIMFVSTIAGVALSCIALCYYNYQAGRGLTLPKQKTKYQIETEKYILTLNNIYWLALTTDDLDAESICNHNILDELRWQIAGLDNKSYKEALEWYPAIELEDSSSAVQKATLKAQDSSKHVLNVVDTTNCIVPGNNSFYEDQKLFFIGFPEHKKFKLMWLVLASVPFFVPIIIFTLFICPGLFYNVFGSIPAAIVYLIIISLLLFLPSFILFNYVLKDINAPDAKIKTERHRKFHTRFLWECRNRNPYTFHREELENMDSEKAIQVKGIWQ